MDHPRSPRTSGLTSINGAEIYYELDGAGPCMIMIHAGVADSRQWDAQLAHFSSRYRVLRYDLRGFGRSLPVAGEFRHMGDLTALIDRLGLAAPFILMGCSMGGGLAMDFALASPGLVAALVMVDSAPSGLRLDVPSPAAFDAVAAAYDVGDLDRIAEAETHLWFDGAGRAAEQVPPEQRRLVLEMDRLKLSHQSKQLGVRRPDAERPAFDRLSELSMPVLVVAGALDTPFILAAADYMEERLPIRRKVIVEGAAHLPNIELPDAFNRAVSDFLEQL